MTRAKALCGEWYRVIGTVSSVDLSIRKMDKRPTRAYKHHPYWIEAKKRVWEKYFNLFIANSSPLTTEEIVATMDRTTSAGVPWAFYGFKKKGNVMDSEYGMHIVEFKSVGTPVVWKISPKTEWYPSSKLDENKVRTFIIPPFHFLWYQKKIYGRQNESMKMFGFSAYGFNPYQGGVDRMAVKLLVNKYFLYYDVVGWDRLLPVLRTVYKMRNQFVGDSPDVKWVTDNVIKSTLLTPMGVLFMKWWGNNSGSGSTTNDNILGHEFIFAFTLFCIYDGDEEMVDRVVANLYGDDNMSSLPDVPDNIEEVVRECYRCFGLELDPFYCSTSLEGCEFLGFKFTCHEGTWIPKYDTSKLMSSFCHDYEKSNVSAVISKAYTICVMCAGDFESGAFEIMQDILQHYFDAGFRKYKGNTVFRSYMEAGVPTRAACLSFYKGFESSIRSELVVVGINNDNFEYNVESINQTREEAYQATEEDGEDGAYQWPSLC